MLYSGIHMATVGVKGIKEDSATKCQKLHSSHYLSLRVQRCGSQTWQTADPSEQGSTPTTTPQDDQPADKTQSCNVFSEDMIRSTRDRWKESIERIY